MSVRAAALVGLVLVAIVGAMISVVGGSAPDAAGDRSPEVPPTESRDRARAVGRAGRTAHTVPDWSSSADPEPQTIDDLVAVLRAARRDGDRELLASTRTTLGSWPATRIGEIVTAIVVEIRDRPDPRVLDVLRSTVLTIASRDGAQADAVRELSESATALRRDDADRLFEADVHGYVGLIRSLCDGDAGRLEDLRAVLAARDAALETARRRLIELIGELRATQYAPPLRAIVGDEAETESVRVAAARALARMGSAEDAWATIAAIASGPSSATKTQLLLSAAAYPDYRLSYELIRDVVQRDPGLGPNEFMLAMLVMRDAQTGRDPRGFASFAWQQVEVELDRDAGIGASLITMLGATSPPRFLDAVREIPGAVARLREIALDEGSDDFLAAGAATSWTALQQDPFEALSFIDESTHPAVRGWALTQIGNVSRHVSGTEAQQRFRSDVADLVRKAFADRSEPLALSGAIHAAQSLRLVDLVPQLRSIADDGSVGSSQRTQARRALAALTAPAADTQRAD